MRNLSPAARALAALLPGVYLSRDATVDGRPLHVLLEVLAAPLAELDAAIDRLRDDHFVERAAPEALPLLADLVGARLLGDDARTNRGVVARTVHWRRRKGTRATLEEVLRVTGGWDAEVDEAFRSLQQTQDLAFPAPWRGRVLDLTDPIAVADPLSRRTSGADPEHLARRPGEDVDEALARLGRVDAGRPATSPRTVDFLGWARPEHAVVATSRVDVAELEQVEAGARREVMRRGEAGVAFAGVVLDPGGRDGPLAGRLPLAPPDAFATLTDLHEPAPPPAPDAGRARMLTPTALAQDPDAVERADSLTVLVDGVRVVGADPEPAAGDDLAVQPVGPSPVLRLSDTERPGPGEDWILHLVAVADPATLPADVFAAEPSGDVLAANPALLRAVVRRGARDAVQEQPAAQVPRGGATVSLRLQRTGTATGHRRRAAGWQRFTIGERRAAPASDVALIDVAGTRIVVRLEHRAAGGLSLASWRPDAPASRWTARVLSLAGMPAAERPAAANGGTEGPQVSLVGLDDGSVVAVGALASGDGLAAWRIPDPSSPTPVLERLDTPPGRRPAARLAPSVCLHGGRVLVFGGTGGARVLEDLWSIATSGPDAGRWTPHIARNRPRRTGGRLLSTPGGLVLLGGASVPGSLDVTVRRVDLTRARPSWEPLADLPVPAGRPGVLWARVAGDGIEAVAWADRTAPAVLRHDATRDRWTSGDPEPDAPNPAAEGEALFVDDELTVVGPPPLPPSEVTFRLAGRGRIAFLPALDLPAADAVAVHAVRDDGSTVRRYLPGEVAEPSLRLGAGRAAPTDRRAAPAQRLGVPGRLAWAPLRLRQVSLGRWDTPLARDGGHELDAHVGLDPRLGRLLVPAALADGVVTASYRVARGAPIGAGFAPPGRQSPTSWVSPERAGVPGADGIPIEPELAAGLARARGGDARLGVLGSPRLPAQTLAAQQRQRVAVWPADTGGVPYVLADDGVSLALHEAAAESVDDDPDAGPSWAFTGLETAGSVELAVAGGDLDLGWCTIGTPGEVALRVAGAGHASPLLRLTLPPVTVRVRLTGCRLGRVELPPWVLLEASGCTFDAGSRDGVAIAAAGADVRLTRCTVHGQVHTGRIAASSCLLLGAVTCDRPEAGWLRYSVHTGRGRPPVAYHSERHRASLCSLDPLHPLHLALAPNNPAAVLTTGEGGCTPGAHSGLAARLREVTERTDDFLPLSLVPHHVDAAEADLLRMGLESTP
ncbi:Phage tail protein (Tail_P2_I) [Micromonospora pattaloongensis]|uniref:Phage tail protein (Tail_P2_I) n=1 Tax=Micromonospora pattaloongensis TaxID=405436 RepID=A0A1H3QN90_9ACTN|nr:phage tail protein [Micromonospora pattaloongensis]SDZ14847.1 Phage tail protein (Tail_P2_I) [Micromonospora pattaloongensis]